MTEVDPNTDDMQQQQFISLPVGFSVQSIGMPIEEMQRQRALCQAGILFAIDKFSRETGCIIDRIDLQKIDTTTVGAKKATVNYTVRLTVEL